MYRRNCSAAHWCTGHVSLKVLMSTQDSEDSSFVQDKNVP